MSVARAQAVRLARAATLTPATVDRVALVATELAENLHRHAGGGDLFIVGPTPHTAGRLVLLAVDSGRGVDDFARCLVDGYTTRGSMGGGLGAVRRLSDDFDAVSELGRGTVVAAGFAAGGADPVAADHFDVGVLGLPLGSETVNGDAFTCTRRGSRLVVLLADGLGHGALAAQASTGAAAQLAELAGRPPVEALDQISRRLVSSRGAAVTVASLELAVARGGGDFPRAGLGNVSLLVAGPDGRSRRVMTSHGTAGVRTGRTIQEQRTEFPARGVLILHSDGLTSRWTLDGRAELLRHTAEVIAAALWRDHVRHSDDSMIAVVRARPAAAPA